jgi:hypothetical protein
LRYPLEVSPAEAKALADIRGYAAAGRIVVTTHARQRMHQRGVTNADLRCALCRAEVCATSEASEGAWKVTGPDLDSAALTCVVVIEGADIVITVF